MTLYEHLYIILIMTILAALILCGLMVAAAKDRRRNGGSVSCPKPKLPPSLKRTCLVCRYVWRGSAQRCARCGSEIVHTEEAGTDG